MFPYAKSEPKAKPATFKMDLTKYRQDMNHAISQAQKLWGAGQEQKSQQQLQRGIQILKYLINNDSMERLKTHYTTMLPELERRLDERKQMKQKVVYAGGSVGKKQGNNKEDQSLQGQINEAIVTEKPNVKWEDVSGLENAKNALKEAVILPIKFPEIFTGSRTPWKGILMYGPPGTGKTYLAKACATECDATFFSVSSSALMSKYVGESEKLIRSLFNSAREKQPSIIFIDEIDSMCGSRSDGENDSSRRVKTQFLVQMQGVGHDDKGVLVLGATNRPWDLDPAIRRRFQRRIYISLPEYEARLGMLKKGMKGVNSVVQEADYVAFAKRAEGYSGSDLNILVRDAVYEPVRRLQTTKKFRKVEGGKYTPCKPGEEGEIREWTEFKKNQLELGEITREDFEVAFSHTKPSVDSTQLAEYVNFTTTFGQEG